MRLFFAAAALIVFGCGGSTPRGGFAADGGFLERDTGGGGGPVADAGTVDAPRLPMEVEMSIALDVPRAGSRYVYVANPLRDTVAVIDSRTLRVSSVEAGDAPTELATVPGRDIAVVLNVGSEDATILRTRDGATTTVNLPIIDDANAIRIDPSGRYAVIFVDTSLPSAGAATNLQEITVVDLSEGFERVVDLSVGFRPLDVLFTTDGTRAFVLTEDGISVLTLAEIFTAAIVPTLAINRPTERRALDIAVTPDGRYAVARQEGTPRVYLVDFESSSVAAVDLGSQVNDIDLAPTGAFALAVLRDTATVVRLPIPAGFVDAAAIESLTIEGEVIGQVAIAQDGARALLFSSVNGVRRVSILALDGALAADTIRLRKDVRSIALSPNGAHALVLHRPGGAEPGASALDHRVAAAFGYSLVDLESGFVKLELTETDVDDHAMTTDGSYAFVTFRDDPRGVREVARVALSTFVVATIPLGSPPTSIGVVPGTGRAFVGQHHTEGRITFIDWATGRLETVTGFELNSRIQ